MDKTAIEKIEQLSVIANGCPTKTHVPVVALPDSSHIHGLEKFLENPLSMRGEMVARRLASLDDYAEHNASDSSALYIDDDSLAAELVIDNGTHETPQWGRHKASLVLKRGFEYAALMDTHTKKFTQNSFIDFMYDFEHSLTFYKDIEMDSAVSFQQAIQSIQKVDVSTVKSMSLEEGDMKRRRSAMEEIEISSDTKPPGIMVLSCVPYPDITVRSFVCRIIFYFGHDEIKVGYRILAIEKQQDEMQLEFTRLLTSAAWLKDIRTYHGKFFKEK